MKKYRVNVNGTVYEVELEEITGAAPAASVATPAAAPAPAPKKAAPAPAGANDIVCPLAAVVVAVNVKEGQQVKAGDLLVTLEAMKMNTPVNSPADGTVSKICVSAGQSVNEGEVLLSLS